MRLGLRVGRGFLRRGRLRAYVLDRLYKTQGRLVENGGVLIYT